MSGSMNDVHESKERGGKTPQAAVSKVWVVVHSSRYKTV